MCPAVPNATHLVNEDEPFLLAIWPQPSTVTDYFALFQNSKLIGLLDFYLLEFLACALFVPMFLAIYIAIRRANESYMALALTLALVFMHGGSLVSPISLEVDDERRLGLLGTNLAAVRESLKNMDGSLTQLVHVGGVAKWVFKHPTIGDALATIVAEDPELLDIYLAGTSTERLCTRSRVAKSSTRWLKS